LSNNSGTNAKNQIVATAWAYDQGGNLLTTAYGGTTTGNFAYDAEHRQVAACGPADNGCTNTAGAGRTLYDYDGDGRRVQTTYATGETTTFVYHIFGSVAAKYSTEHANLLCNTCYLTTDQSGSTRVMTNQAGAMVFRQDYLPFGEAVLISSTSPRYGIAGYGAKTAFFLKTSITNESTTANPLRLSVRCMKTVAPQLRNRPRA
jgi:YD repeat-containing protein